MLLFYKKVKGWQLTLIDTEDEMPIEDEKGNGRLAAKIPISAHTGFCEDCSFERYFERANSAVFNERSIDPWFKKR
ncbi:hypothetical protein Tco_0206699 [Tanacetum coccineum]